MESSRAFLSDLGTSLGALGFVFYEKGDLQATRDSNRVGLAVLLSALVIDTQAHQPLADALAQNDYLLFQSLGKDPDPDLMASYAAAFADGKASS